MTYDHWKTTNPDDEQLGNANQSGDWDDAEPYDYPTDEELARWEHFCRYDEDGKPDEASAEYQDRKRNK